MILSISEIFESIQGEGTSIGLPALFVRLQGCNLTCSWCDTPYTWKPGQNRDFRKYEVEKLVDEVADQLRTAPNHKIVVFTGGEPLLQQDGLNLVISLLRRRRILSRFEIETNGTIFPDLLEDHAETIQLNVSPKLANSQIEKSKRFRPEILSRLAASDSKFEAFFKFVVVSPSELNEILSDFDFVPRERMIVMPEGITRKSQIEGMMELVDLCKEFGLRLIPRMHTLIWENRRGV